LQNNQEDTVDFTLGQANGFLAPVNVPASYAVVHPNSQNNPIEDQMDRNDGPFWNGDCLDGATSGCFKLWNAIVNYCGNEHRI
jgi:hypothetical protein